jgi:hypothetical protein
MQRIRVKELESKIPQLFRNREVVFSVLPKIVAFRALPANVLNHTGSDSQPEFVALVRILFG